MQLNSMNINRKVMKMLGITCLSCVYIINNLNSKAHFVGISLFKVMRYYNSFSILLYQMNLFKKG